MRIVGFKQPEFRQLVVSLWNQANHRLTHKIQHMGSTLQKWGRNLNKKLNIKKKHLKIRLEVCRDNNTDEHTNLRAELSTILDIERIQWKQRAKEFWLQEGDANTEYFHLAANNRK